MSAAREVVAHVLVSHHTNGLCPLDGPCEMCDCFDPKHKYEREIADAVLAALREHWTSDEEVNRISKDFHAGWYALVIAALFEEADRG